MTVDEDEADELPTQNNKLPITDGAAALGQGQEKV